MVQSNLDRAVELMPLSEEDAQRQLCISVEQIWIVINQSMQAVEGALLKQIQQSSVPLDERIACIECSLARIQNALTQFPSSCNTQEDVSTRRKELKVIISIYYNPNLKLTMLSLVMKLVNGVLLYSYILHLL